MKVDKKTIQGLIVSGLITISCNSYADDVDSLAAYYNFDDCKITDSSGRNNDGDLYGSPQCVTGRKGKALYFDGKSYAKIPNSTSLNPYKEWTMAFWIKADELPSTTYSSILHKGDRLGTTTCLAEREYIVHLTNSLILHTSSGGDKDCHHRANATKITTAKWYHFAVVIDRNKHTIKNYINGKLVGTTPDSYNTFNNNKADLYIGSSVEISNRTDLSNFKGTLDDLRFYNKALTDDEIQTLYFINPSVKVSISGLKDKSVTCRNNTTGQEVTIEGQPGSLQDCKKAGLKTKSNQKVSVLIDGSTY